MATAQTAAEAAHDEPTGGFAAWYLIAVLLLFYIFSSIDRGVISMMVQPLERDLHISDFQISLLQGPAFAIFYAVCGLPMGWLLDRLSRRGLVTFGVVLWGAATCACGLAGSFAQLLIGRMGVGVGESVLTPAAHSMISERFPRRRLALAISVFTMGSVIGVGLALAFTGLVVHIVTNGPPLVVPVLGALQSWQAVFLIVGAPPVLLSPLIFTIRETRRRARVVAQPREKGEVAAWYRKNWRIALGIPVAFGCTNIAANVMIAWGPTFLIRTFEWNAKVVGLRYGLVVVIAGAIGQLGGGAIVDWLYGRGVKDAHVRYHIIGILFSAPLLALAILSRNPALFFVGQAVFYCVTYPYVGYAAAALQMFTPDRLRGFASAVFLAVITLVGSLIGPPAVPLVAERLLGDKAMLGPAMAICILVAAAISVTIQWRIGKIMRAAPAAD